MDHLDLVIVGGGPIGLACGIEAAKAGLKYLIIEKGALVNSLYHYPENMTFFSTSEKLEIGGVPFVSHHHKPVKNEALEYYRRVTQQCMLSVSFYDQVTSIHKAENPLFYKIISSRNTYYCTSVIIATGFYDIPNLMNVPGEQLPKVFHYYKDAHPYFLQKIAVVGAANSAIDVALECYRKGADVTMIIRESSISDRVKYWVKPDIENRIREGSIKVFFNSIITSIHPENIQITTNENQILTIDNDYVFAMTGYLPDFNFLTSVGITLSEDGSRSPFFNNETMETNVPDIYLAGVVCGGLNTHKWFIENSRCHAEVIVKNIVAKSGKLT